MKSRTLVIVVALLTSGFIASAACAQIHYDAKAYEQLVDADSTQTIPVGTGISAANWRQYRRFMPIGIQALFGGQYLWKIGAGEDHAMAVGPAISTPAPRQFVLDTEKYSSQVKLKKLSGNAYTIEGYVAGLPFPAPAAPELAAKVYFNAYYYFRPLVSYSPDLGWNEDRYHNATMTIADVTTYRLSHNSESGRPVNPGYGAGYLFSDRYVLLEPEQTRYTSEIALYHDDPTKPQELYLFLPSLRRSLRLSAAARCSPLLGSDYAQDDNNNFLGVLVSDFQLLYVGHKKVLAIMHKDPGQDGKLSAYAPTTAPMPAWPKPVDGKWEVRDVYVIDIFPTAELASRYCYGHKIVYIDRESWVPVAAEVYDPHGSLWKIFFVIYQPWRINDTEKVIIPQTGVDVIADMQNSHMGLSMQYAEQIDDQAPQSQQDAAVMAFPASLSQVMK
jgi:uncharacterized protein DUF1329